MILWVLLVLFCTLGKGADSEPDDAVDQRLIESQLQRFAYMYHKQQTTDFNNTLSPEIYALAPGFGIMRGREQTFSWVKINMKYGVRELPFDNEGTVVFSDVAVQVDHITEYRADGTIMESGKDLMVWEKSWQLLYSAWNSNS